MALFSALRNPWSPLVCMSFLSVVTAEVAGSSPVVPAFQRTWHYKLASNPPFILMMLMRRRVWSVGVNSGCLLSGTCSAHQ